MSPPRSRPPMLWKTIVVLCCAAVQAVAEGGAGTVIDQLDRLWDERANPSAVEEAVTIGERFQEAQPANYEVTWRLARACWRKGDLATERSQRQQLYAVARRYAESAAQLDPQRVEGHYYFALTTGDYGGTLSLLGAISEGIGPTFEREIKRAYEINRDFDHGAPLLALGRFYSELPWPKRDRQASRRYLEELRQRHPEVLLGHLYLAETVHALGDDDTARTELQYVMTHNPVHDRAFEEQDIRSDARRYLHEWFGATVTP